jgi:peptidoglycan/xylan/chitin deacetylase (PgdA/CDA1 family)
MRIAKHIAYWLAIMSGLTWLAARLSRRKVLILCYHGVFDGPGDPLLNFDGMHVRVRRFARQMRYLSRRYRVVTLDELLDGMAPSSADRPLAVITIDDGYRNIYRFAYPILKRLKLPATLFLPTDFVLDGRGMWWDRLRVMLAATECPALRLSVDGTERLLPISTVEEQVAALPKLSDQLRCLPSPRREVLMESLAASLRVPGRDAGTFGEPLAVAEIRDMLAHGMAVGSHGASHDSLPLLDPHALSGELTESKRLLELLTKASVRWLAYPHGKFSPAVADAAVRAGYRGAVTTIEALNDGLGDPYTLRRIGVHDRVTIAHFIFATCGLRDFLLGILAGWKRLWSRPHLSRPRPSTPIRPAGLETS